MTARKELDAECTGDIFCRVDGHKTARGSSRGGVRFGHIDLTVGQRKTLRERERARRTRQA